jgi:hypothetical protein
MQDLENDKFNSLELGSGDLFEGEALAGLDGKACERLITQNKKKARKVNDALNSNHEIWSWKSLTKATPQSQSRKPISKTNLENQPPNMVSPKHSKNQDRSKIDWRNLIRRRTWFYFLFLNIFLVTNWDKRRILRSEEKTKKGKKVVEVHAPTIDSDMV